MFQSVKSLLALAALSAGLASSFALAAPAAHPPKIDGMWMIRQEYYLGQPLLPKPELTEVVKAQIARRTKAQAAGYVRTVDNMLCTPAGGPQLYAYRSPFEIFQGFGRLTFIFETEGSNQPRTIYMREKAQPADIYPTFNGHSIGRWAGKTLVIDTVGFNGRGIVLGQVPKSTQTHLTERISWSANGKVMTNQITVEDPATLVKPWTTTLVFDRMADSEERFEVWCEVDLDAFKTVNLESLKDADPEIARMLDPKERATDPALKIQGPGK